MDKLKPCPFCGGEAEYKHAQYGTYGKYRDCVRIACSACYVHTIFYAEEDKPLGHIEQAIEAWNRRASDA